MVVSPDVGAVARARAFAKKLDAPLAIVDKRFQEHNHAEVVAEIMFLISHFTVLSPVGFYL